MPTTTQTPRQTTRTFAAGVVGMIAGQRRHHLLSTTVGTPARVVPEYDNEFDATAVRVEVMSAGEYRHIGYLPRALAARVHPNLSAEGLDGTVDTVRTNPDDGLPVGLDVAIPMTALRR